MDPPERVFFYTRGVLVSLRFPFVNVNLKTDTQMSEGDF